jgi:hypothetical protein
MTQNDYTCHKYLLNTIKKKKKKAFMDGFFLDGF